MLEASANQYLCYQEIFAKMIMAFEEARVEFLLFLCYLDLLTFTYFLFYMQFLNIIILKIIINDCDV